METSKNTQSSQEILELLHKWRTETWDGLNGRDPIRPYAATLEGLELIGTLLTIDPQSSEAREALEHLGSDRPFFAGLSLLETNHEPELRRNHKAILVALEIHAVLFPEDRSAEVLYDLHQQILKERQRS